LGIAKIDLTVEVDVVVGGGVELEGEGFVGVGEGVLAGEGFEGDLALG
jgi:hypothetical protein